MSPGETPLVGKSPSTWHHRYLPPNYVSSFSVLADALCSVGIAGTSKLRDGLDHLCLVLKVEITHFLK